MQPSARARVAVITVARSDFSILSPVMNAIADDPDLDLVTVVAGMHLAPEFGLTHREVEAAGYRVDEKVEMLLSSDSGEGTAKSIGLGVIGFAQALRRLAPAMLVIMGDRFEMLACAVAALPLGLPIAHIHGGELTAGAFDDAARHAITKLSHLHFVSLEDYRRRVIQMGEPSDRVIVSGAPGLDNLRTTALRPADELERCFGLDLSRPPILVTVHPVTRSRHETDEIMTTLFPALAASGRPVVVTAPNADPLGRALFAEIRSFVEAHPHVRLVSNLGLVGYYSLMRVAAAMAGNSSSGILEAASFGLPVVDIGSRQRGRHAGANVAHVAPVAGDIETALAWALDPQTRDSMRCMTNPYGDGRAAERIVAGIKAGLARADLGEKPFHDLTATA